MRRIFRFSGSTGEFRSVRIFAGLPALALALATTGSQRIRPLPRFTPAETIRYQIETQTTASGKTSTPIANPEGASQMKQKASLVVRLEVLDVQPAAKDAMGSVRLRATYEKSRAESEIDAYSPRTPSLAEQYARLEGHSIEFTIEPGGRLSNFKGLEDIFPTRSAADPVLSWVTGLSSGAGFPRKGIVVGQKWSSERPLEGAPLAGVVWRTESTYLRNEPCFPPGGANAAARASGANTETCAAILTRFDIFRRGSRGDATPDDYRRNGLRTSGKWTGSGESLDSISLATGLLVNSTQTSTQDMDYEIVSASTGSSIHHVGRVESQSEIRLVPQASPQP